MNDSLMNTDVEVEHILEILPRTVLGEKMWTAKIQDGIGLALGQTFTLEETIPTGTQTAPPLTVVAGSPASAYEIQEGRYTFVEICNAFNLWTAQAVTDTHIDGSYKIGGMGAPDGTIHGKFRYALPDVPVGDSHYVEVSFPWTIHNMLGTFAGATGAIYANQTLKIIENDETFHSVLSVNQALRSIGEPARCAVRRVRLVLRSRDVDPRRTSGADQSDAVRRIRRPMSRPRHRG